VNHIHANHVCTRDIVVGENLCRQEAIVREGLDLSTRT
jgi:hypothetical protein